MQASNQIKADTSHISPWKVNLCEKAEMDFVLAKCEIEATKNESLLLMKKISDMEEHLKVKLNYVANNQLLDREIQNKDYEIIKLKGAYGENFDSSL